MRGINFRAESMPRNRLQVAINFLKYHFRVDGAVVERREEFQQLGDSFSHQAAWTAFHWLFIVFVYRIKLNSKRETDLSGLLPILYGCVEVLFEDENLLGIVSSSDFVFPICQIVKVSGYRDQFSVKI